MTFTLLVPYRAPERAEYRKLVAKSVVEIVSTFEFGQTLFCLSVSIAMGLRAQRLAVGASVNVVGLTQLLFNSAILCRM